MYKKFSPFTIICVMIIVVVVIGTILSTAIPSIMSMRDKLNNRTNYMMMVDDVGEVPMH